MVETQAYGSIEVGPTAQTRQRFYLVDALRFVAAIAVVLFHYTSVTSDSNAWGRSVTTVFPVLSQFTAYGALGVQLFFVISGFVILMSAWGRSVPQFVASRISRLYPAYWFAVIATTILGVAIVPRQHGITVGQFMLNLSMMQAPFGADDVDGVYWTLFTELRFYVIIGIFLAVGFTTNRVLAFCALWPFVAAIGSLADNPALNEILIVNQSGLFAGGMVIYLMHRNGPRLIYWLVLAECAAMSAYQASIHQFPLTAEHTGVDMSVTVYIALILSFFAVMVLVTQTRLRFVSWKWLAAIGLLTYPLYLIHAHWGWWLISLLYPSVPPYVALGITVVTVLVVAYLINRFIERPINGPFRRALVKSMRPGDGELDPDRTRRSAPS